MAAPALVALAHGSRDPRSAATIKALVDEVRALRPDLRIEPAFLELSKPDFADGRRPARQGRPRRDRGRAAAAHRGLPRQGRRARGVAEATARHPGLQIRATDDPRPRAALPRGARPADARGAQGRAGPRARRPRPGRGRLLRPARQPGGRPAGPALGHPPQAAGHRGVRLGRSAGHRRGGARVPRRGPPPHRGRLAVPGARASCPTGPPSSRSRPAPSRSPSRSAPTRSWPARSWRATPSAPSSWSRSEPGRSSRRRSARVVQSGDPPLPVTKSIDLEALDGEQSLASARARRHRVGWQRDRCKPGRCTDDGGHFASVAMTATRPVPAPPTASCLPRSQVPAPVVAVDRAVAAGDVGDPALARGAGDGAGRRRRRDRGAGTPAPSARRWLGRRRSAPRAWLGAPRDQLATRESGHRRPRLRRPRPSTKRSSRDLVRSRSTRSRPFRVPALATWREPSRCGRARPTAAARPVDAPRGRRGAARSTRAGRGRGSSWLTRR